MADRPRTPRLSPVPPDAWTDEQRELLAPPMPALNVFATLARHPRLLARWPPFARKVLNGSGLPTRERELIVLRVAWRCRAAYEWAQHVPLAREAGCTDDEIRALAGERAVWDGPDGHLVAAIDELVDDHCIGDATWTALAETWSETQLIEIPALAGNYVMFAGMLNSFGTQTAPASRVIARRMDTPRLTAGG